MALFFPLHLPPVPLRWDEPIWTGEAREDPVAAETTLLEDREQRALQERASLEMRQLSDAMCGLPPAAPISDLDQSAIIPVVGPPSTSSGAVATATAGIAATAGLAGGGADLESGGEDGTSGN